MPLSSLVGPSCQVPVSRAFSEGGILIFKSPAKEMFRGVGFDLFSLNVKAIVATWST